MTTEQIERMNQLYHKSKAEGLNPAEQEEHIYLKNMFITDFRKNLKAQLDNIDIENEDGTITNLGEKYGKKTNQT